MKQRLLAIDVFRGMTIAFMILVNNPGSWSHVYAPLLHAEWHGCTPTDLVFPFFIFTVGLSMAFSMGKNRDKSTTFLLQKALKRAGLIFLVGYLLHWFPFYDRSLAEVRVFGVLQRIGLAYGLGATLVLLLKREVWLFWTSAGGLLAYWAIQTYFGDYTLADNVNRTADLAILPEEVLYMGFGIPFDPEGWLGTLPTAIQIVIGYLVGQQLYQRVQTSGGFQTDSLHKFIPALLLTGLSLVLSGWVWNWLGYPINKPIWTGSYVLYTSGLAMVLLASLLYLLDILKFRKWSFPFRVFGLNPLLAYLLSGIIAKLLYLITVDGRALSSLIYINVLQPVFGNKPASLVQALLMVGLIYFLVWVLYRRKIVVKL